MNTKERKFFNSRPLFYGFLALMLAICTSRYIFDGNLKYIFFVSSILGVFFAYCIWAKKWNSLLIIFSIFLFGMGWFFVGKFSFEGVEYSGNCQIVGRISDNVNYSVYGSSANVVLKNVYINGKKEKNIDLTIYISSKSDFEIGDIIAFEATVDKVPLFTLESFNSFFYRDGTPYSSSVTAADFSIQGNNLKVDESCRLKIKSVLYENMGEENGAVAYAVLFGDKSEVDDTIFDAYKTSGIIHLLTVSGLHIGFLIALIGYILKKCKVRGVYNFLICAACLGFYSYACGFAPSIVRAGIMGLVLLATKLSGKSYDNLNSLGLAGIIILLYSPLSALDLGFLMSFFCVLGIFVVSPWLIKILKRIFPKPVAEGFAISIGAQIGVLPFMAEMFSSFNSLTLFVNLIVIPIFSIIYPFLFISSLIAAVLPFMGFLLKISGFGLTCINGLADFFGKTNLKFQLVPLNIFLVALCFFLFFLLGRFFMASRKAKAMCCTSVFVLCCVFGVVASLPPPAKSSVAYGYNYSNSILLLTNKAGESVIVDPGYFSFTKRFLNSQSVTNVETAFVLQKSSVYIDTAQSIGVKNLIRSDSGQGFDEEILIEYNVAGEVGGFSFIYRAYQNKLVGLEIAFDQTKVFILRDLNQTVGGLTFVAETDYDIVILGKHDSYIDFFFGKASVLTYYENELSDWSFMKHGNIACLINGNKYKWRCVD